MSTDKSTVPKLKVVLLGSSGVGKSSLMRAFLDDEFDPASEATVGVDFRPKRLQVVPYSQKEPKWVEMLLWDTAGQEKFHSLIPTYYRGAKGYILVYDITSKQSFQELESQWIPDVQEKGNFEDSWTILIGAKSDLESARAVEREEASSLARKHRMLFMETSSKTRGNVKEAFDDLLSRILDNMQDTMDSSTLGLSSPNQENGGCCF